MHQRKLFAVIYQLVLNSTLAIYIQKLSVCCNDHDFIRLDIVNLCQCFMGSNIPSTKGLNTRILKNMLCARIPSKHSSWWRRLSYSSSKDVLVKTNIFVLSIRLQDVFKAFPRHLQDVIKRSRKYVLKTSSRRFEDVSSS